MAAQIYISTDSSQGSMGKWTHVLEAFESHFSVHYSFLGLVGPSPVAFQK